MHIFSVLEEYLLPLSCSEYCNICAKKSGAEMDVEPFESPQGDLALGVRALTRRSQLQSSFTPGTWDWNG